MIIQKYLFEHSVFVILYHLKIPSTKDPITTNTAIHELSRPMVKILNQKSKSRLRSKMIQTSVLV